MKKLLLSTAVFLTLGSSAFAADVISAEPPAGFVWTGGYVGLQVGYGWGRDRVTDENRNNGISDLDDRFSLNGALGGVYFGYNHQIDNWVLGAEGDIELSGMKSGMFDGWMQAKIDAQGSLRARVGYAFDNNLLYLTGGLAIADIKTRYEDRAGEDSFSTVRAGWTIGAGLEHAFAPNWIARIEYRYADFGKFTDWTQVTDTNWNYTHRVTENAIRIGVSYKF